MRSMEKPPYTMRVPRKSEPEYYTDQVLPILLRRRVRPLAKLTYFLMLSGFHVIQKILLQRMMQKKTNSWAILQVLQLTKFDYRLSSNLDDELQKLRCRVNYHALKFTKSINELGQKLVMRMRQMAERFVAVHLRFVCYCLLI